jgi:hypothetical protein
MVIDPVSIVACWQSLGPKFTVSRFATGMVYPEAPLYYESVDCTGQAYTGARSPGTVFMPTLDDSAAYASGAMYYSPNDAQAVTVNVNSRLVEPLTCVPEVSTREVYPA